jgi:phospholipase C
MASIRTAIALGISVVAMGATGFGAAAEEEHGRKPTATTTPIEHVIVIIGENRTFDHLFATYRPRSGGKVDNLLARGIVGEDGKPGPHFAQAAQFTAVGTGKYFISAAQKTPYSTLPPPDLNGTHSAPSDTDPPPFKTVALAAAAEPGIPASEAVLLTTGASGRSGPGPDTRIANVMALPNGPFQLTGPTLPDDSYTGDTIHRFYQMWQQSDCSVAQAAPANPAGCLNDLYPYVSTTSSQKAHEGGTSMAFVNMAKGDAPYLKELADTYTIADNYHQAVQGGTGANHVLLGTGHAIWYGDANGNPVAPPAALVANPNPRPGTKNAYLVDGGYSNCSDPTAPGVGAITDYLATLPNETAPNCAPGHYYLLNNLLPGFNPDGTRNISPAAVPPSSVRTIGDALLEKNISFRYYGGGFNAAVAGQPNAFCPICNPFQYVSSIYGDPALRAEHNKDVVDLFADLASGALPAVSLVKPSELLDGHPQSSKTNLFEAFVRNILTKLQANPALQAKTAVLVTFDEGGGYYDSGYIQPIDFFGDGPRVPMIVVSAYSKGGRVVHTYYDHASILKFIERNWRLKPLTERSRDNLPNPVTEHGNRYVPVNSPAIGDLMDAFRFDGRDDNEDEDG